MWPYYAFIVNAVLNSMLCENVILEQLGPRAFAVEACALNLTCIEIFFVLSRHPNNFAPSVAALSLIDIFLVGWYTSSSFFTLASDVCGIHLPFYSLVYL